MLQHKNTRNNLLSIQEILQHVDNHEYEEAYFLSSKITNRAHTDEAALYCSWVEALTNFFTYERRDYAIGLMEKIKPVKLVSELDFRILNALVCFYLITDEDDNFEICATTLYQQIHLLDNKQLAATFLFNIANGYYTFKNYELAITIANQSIEQYKDENIFNMFFCMAVMIKIVSFHYLDQIELANKLTDEYISFLEFTDNMSYKKYLDKALAKKKMEE